MTFTPTHTTRADTEVGIVGPSLHNPRYLVVQDGTGVTMTVTPDDITPIPDNAIRAQLGDAT